MVFAERENDTGLYVDLVIIGFGTRVYLFCRNGISVPEVQSENSSAPDSGRCEPGLQIVILVHPVAGVQIGQIVRHAPERIGYRTVVQGVFDFRPRIIEGSPHIKFADTPAAFRIEQQVGTVATALWAVKIPVGDGVPQPYFGVAPGLVEYRSGCIDGRIAPKVIAFHPFECGGCRLEPAQERIRDGGSDFGGILYLNLLCMRNFRKLHQDKCSRE